MWVRCTGLQGVSQSYPYAQSRQEVLAWLQGLGGRGDGRGGRRVAGEQGQAAPGLRGLPEGSASERVLVVWAPGAM